MARGGAKPGERRGGRKPGSKNKRTEEREKALAAAAEKIGDILGPGAFEGDGHAFLMMVYRSAGFSLSARLAAASAAIPYEKPRLAQVKHEGKLELTLAELIIATTKDEEGKT